MDFSCIDQGQGIYYVKKNDSIDPWEYLTDHLAQQDAAMQEPLASSFQTLQRNLFGTYYQTDQAAYEQAWRAYQEKLDRDALRQELKTTDLNMRLFNEIWYYDGTENTRLLEQAFWDTNINLCNQEVQAYGAEKPVFVKTEDLKLPTVDLSEMAEVYDFQYLLNEAVNEQIKEGVPAQVLIDGTLLEMDYSNRNIYLMNADKKQIYLMEREAEGDLTQESYREWMESLKQMSYSADGIQKAETLDDDFDEELSYPIEDEMLCQGDLYYIKNYDSERREGTLCRNGEKLLDDISAMMVVDDQLYLMTDQNDKGEYTLSILKKDQMEELAEEVYSFTVLEDGTIAALIDYREDRQRGDLYLLRKGKSELLDEDVTGLLGEKRQF